MSLTFKLSATNLGPHQNLNESNSLNSLKIGIFAANGIGKTFFSRAFRIIDSDDIDKTNQLISFGKNSADFKLEINNTGDPTPNRTLSISLERDKVRSIQDTTNYIFHIFNSDYVQENIEKMRYRPDGEIEGYIVGKDIIDLTNEKDELKSIKDQIESDKNELKTAIENSKKELETLSVNKSTTEYRDFNIENILGKKVDIQIKESYEELKKQNTTLNLLPDDFEGITRPELIVNTDFIDPIKTLLTTKHNKGLFAEEFKNKIKSKQNFIEEGIRLISNSTCPFCEQTLDKQALDLIDSYTKFLADEEAKIIKQAENFTNQLQTLKKQIDICNLNFSKINTKFNELKNYLPSYKNHSLIGLENIDNFELAIEKISLFLAQKKVNVENNLYEPDLIELIETINNYISKSKNNLASDSNLISKINTTKNDLAKEKLALKKKLCQAKHLFVSNKEKDRVYRITDNELAYSKLEVEINEKESKVKASKKEVVDNSFEFYLNQFFAGKYSFDKDKRCLKFQNQDLINNAHHVLSDGEKSIVAFCYYLAETHKRIAKTEDYMRLFFVMDDPISSLDFHYVYSVAEIIRSLPKQFDVGDRPKYLIFTHNMEFMNILICNEIIKNPFVLSNQKIKLLHMQLIMPYESHLRDVYDVANGSTPTHTTANSIRHIIETINNFENPDLNLREYFESREDLKQNAYLYSLIQDISHGRLRTEKPYTEEMISEGCKTVISFIESRYSGQIKQLVKK